MLGCMLASLLLAKHTSFASRHAVCLLQLEAVGVKLSTW